MQRSQLSAPTFPPALANGQRFRHIVDVACRQRAHLVKSRKSAPVNLYRLQCWLDRNPWPSESTVQAFRLMADLEMAMPHHAAGRKMLEEARELTSYKPIPTHQ